MTTCTSAVIQDGDGPPYHLRNLDWDINQLRLITVDIQLVNEIHQGAPTVLCHATTWPLSVGFYTGMKFWMA